MEIKTENWAENINCIYAVVFNTGYYYIGSTKSFFSRARNHRLTISQYPEKFGIGLFHHPTKCEIFMLLACHDYAAIVGLERDFIIQNSHDTYMLNRSKSICKLKTVKEKLCKKMIELKK
jgi:hypothetical protein